MSRSSEEIVIEMLNNLPDDFDKSTGTVAYDLQKPTAIELAAMDEKADTILNNAFYDSADDAHKEIIAQARAGITRKPATYATGFVTITGVAGTIIFTGTRVASNFLEYVTTEEATVGTEGSVSVPVVCETPGETGNAAAGEINTFSITLEGLYTVTNPEAITGGYEQESIEELSERYHAYMDSPPGSGNAGDYERWAQEVEGVGEAKCFPRTPTIGSVTTYITNRSHRAADADLVQAVYDYIEEKRPCPATSIIEPAEEVEIDVSVDISVASGVAADYQEAVATAIDSYIKSIKYKGNNRRVSYALVGDAILSVTGVNDYDSLTINGEDTSVDLGATEIAVLDDVEVS